MLINTEIYFVSLIEILETVVRQNKGKIWRNLETAQKFFFSLLILVVQTLTLKNPSNNTLSSLSVLKYSRWRIGWLPFGTIKTV